MQDIKTQNRDKIVRSFLVGRHSEKEAIQLLSWLYDISESLSKKLLWQYADLMTKPERV